MGNMLMLDATEEHSLGKPLKCLVLQAITKEGKLLPRGFLPARNHHACPYTSMLLNFSTRCAGQSPGECPYGIAHLTLDKAGLFRYTPVWVNYATDKITEDIVKKLPWPSKELKKVLVKLAGTWYHPSTAPRNPDSIPSTNITTTPTTPTTIS